MNLLPVLLTAVAVAGLAHVLIDLVTRARSVDPALGSFEVQRRERIRQHSELYRLFEPWVDDLAKWFERESDVKQATLKKNMVSAGMSVPWKASEFRAVKRIEAILAGLVCAFLGRFIIGGTIFALATGVAAYFLYDVLAQRLVLSRAIRRRIRLKRRFSTAIDLMALMMEVGGGFEESLEVAARENAGHPLGEELSIVRKELEFNRLTKKVLRDFAERTQDEDVDEVVMAVVEGQELGTPLAEILRTQAEQMRQKRSQWAEKAAEESQVALVFPAMIIMLACLITVAAPFILDAIYEGM